MEDGNVWVTQYKKSTVFIVIKTVALYVLPISVIILGILAACSFVRGECKKCCGETDNLEKRSKVNKVLHFMVMVVAVFLFPITIIVCGIESVIECLNRQRLKYAEVTVHNMHIAQCEFVLQYAQCEIALTQYDAYRKGHDLELGGIESHTDIEKKIDAILERLQDENSTVHDAPHSVEVQKRCIERAKCLDNETKIMLKNVEVAAKKLGKALGVKWDGDQGIDKNIKNIFANESEFHGKLKAVRKLSAFYMNRRKDNCSQGKSFTNNIVHPVVEHVITDKDQSIV